MLQAQLYSEARNAARLQQHGALYHLWDMDPERKAVEGSSGFLPRSEIATRYLRGDVRVPTSERSA